MAIQSDLRRLTSAIRFRTTRKPTLHFIHIPKTGGSAAKTALRGHELEGDYALRMHSHRLRLSDVPEGQGFFFALRDPAKRFASAFNSRKNFGRPRNDIAWTEEETALFTRFETAEALAEALYAEDDETRAAARAAMGSVHHFKPVADWLGGPSALERRSADLFTVLFQESLDADFAAFAQRVGLGVALPTDDVGAHRGPRGSSSMSEAALEALRQWYADDLALIDLARRLRG